ncbi:MAG: biopolymer transporter ExbD, partial [Acidobacteriia bacterium]|nr:biopolymer transporter ExbD [Terriglobia bacterium]
KTGINMTPMIDILLVLIIIFMMIAPEKSTGIPALAPQGAGSRESGRDIIVRVAEDGSLTINTEPVGWPNFADRLAGSLPRARKKSCSSPARRKRISKISRASSTPREARESTASR